MRIQDTSTRSTTGTHDVDAAAETGIRHRLDTCSKCGGKLRVIACIEDLDVVTTILEHIRTREAAANFGSVLAVGATNRG